MSRSRLSFSLDEARPVLWARCLEEADATGVVVPAEARAAASRMAGELDDAAFLTKRAAILAELPGAPKAPEVAAGSWLAKLPAWAPWAVIGGAFLLGWVVNELGPDKSLNLLSFPLLGLIVWNLGVCAVSLWADWKARRQPAAAPAARRRAPGIDAGTAARAEYAARIAAWERPVQQAKMKWTFHAAALALALGIIGGMYMRGLAKEYKATWQSTFLERPQVTTLTNVVLGPASLITGIRVPDPGPKSGDGQPAAPWIHLWAASALLFIGIPRLLLANMARLQAQRARPDCDAEFGPWLAVCRSLASGHSQKADVLPVHYEPEPRVRDALRLVMQHLWGAHVGADFQKPVAYGGEESAALSPAPQYLAVVFPLATTPESEVHGTLLRTLAASGPERSRRLMVLDASGFEARFRTLAEYPERLAARRASWEKVAAGAYTVLLLDDAARRDPAAAARSLSPS